MFDGAGDVEKDGERHDKAAETMHDMGDGLQTWRWRCRSIHECETEQADFISLAEREHDPANRHIDRRNQQNDVNDAGGAPLPHGMIAGRLGQAVADTPTQARDANQQHQQADRNVERYPCGFPSAFRLAVERNANGIMKIMAIANSQ